MIDYDYINQLENKLVKENRHLNMIDIEETYQQAYGKAVKNVCEFLKVSIGNELDLFPYEQEFNDWIAELRKYMKA